jgi:uncharacterized protein YukE
MADTVLLATLERYAQQLEEHVATLRGRHQELEAAWVRLRGVYEGEGAEMFGEAFESASARLADYASQGALIERHLQAKIADLRAFQGADPEL